MPVKIVPPRRAWAVRQMARLWLRREDLRQALNDSIALIDAQNLLLDGMKEENDQLTAMIQKLTGHVASTNGSGTMASLWEKIEELEEVIAGQVKHNKAQTLKINSLQNTISSMLAAVTPDGAAEAAVDQAEAALNDALMRFRAVTRLLVVSQLDPDGVDVVKNVDGYTFFAPAAGCVVKVPKEFVTDTEWKKLNSELPVHPIHPVHPIQVGPYAGQPKEVVGAVKTISGIPTVHDQCGGLVPAKITADKLMIDKIEWGKYTVPAGSIPPLAIKNQEPGLVIEDGAYMTHTELALMILEKCGVKLEFVETIEDETGIPLNHVRIGLTSHAGNSNNAGIFAHLKKVSGQ